jgi:hypothetical protein
MNLDVAKTFAWPLDLSERSTENSCDQQSLSASSSASTRMKTRANLLITDRSVSEASANEGDVLWSLWLSKSWLVSGGNGQSLLNQLSQECQNNVCRVLLVSSPEVVKDIRDANVFVRAEPGCEVVDDNRCEHCLASSRNAWAEKCPTGLCQLGPIFLRL